jgi:hypothetical protein
MPNELNAPKASPAKVAYHLKQLRKPFSRSSDRELLQMMWAIDALRSGRPEIAARLLTFPPQVADQSFGSRFAIHQWELETLLIQLLLTSKETPPSGTTAACDCSKFESVADLVNRLRRLENDFNLPQFYRNTFIYAQGKCGEYFEKTYGLPITELNFVGFALAKKGAPVDTPDLLVKDVEKVTIFIGNDEDFLKAMYGTEDDMATVLRGDASFLFRE